MTEQTITITQGDHKEGTIPIVKKINGVIVGDGNITGAKLWLTVKTSHDLADEAAEFQYNSDDNPTNIWIENSKTIGYLIAATDSSNLTLRKYKFDFQVLLATGRVHTVAKGTLEVEWQATKAIS